MKFCSSCGAEVTHKIPQGDNRKRFVCTECDTVHYQNPRIIAGCIAEYDNQILLCKRAIEPRYGLWTLPAGFMENGETTMQAAARESHEEALAELSDMYLYCTYSIPHISQVYMMYRATLVDGHSRPGEESLETRLFQENEIPWESLAFPVVRESLKLYFNDRKQGQFPVRNGAIYRQQDQIIIENYEDE